MICESDTVGSHQNDRTRDILCQTPPSNKKDFESCIPTGGSPLSSDMVIDHKRDRVVVHIIINLGRFHALPGLLGLVASVYHFEHKDYFRTTNFLFLFFFVFFFVVVVGGRRLAIIGNQIPAFRPLAFKRK